MRTGNVLNVRSWIYLRDLLLASCDPITADGSTVAPNSTQGALRLKYSWRQKQKFLSYFLLCNSYGFQMVLIKDFRNGFYDVIQHQVKRSSSSSS